MLWLPSSDSLPAASTLLTRTVLGPGTKSKEADQFVVPVASWNGLLPTWYRTWTTRRLSLARPCKVTVPLVKREFGAGEVIETVGFITSTKFATSTRLDCMAKTKWAFF